MIRGFDSTRVTRKQLVVLVTD
ncbi:hypothetical protein Zm00014a_030462 [Zea mays]|uniref:Uncharacterized protein n=1 Tax=Zea mays TaxID=4577 RepID=A0A3L6DKW6_MAIZE|nr:hypothetical protein Zm00014a_030462 [Zea mays]